MGSGPIAGVLIRREETQREIHPEGRRGEESQSRRPCEEGGRGWSDVPTSRGGCGHQELEEARADSP